MISQREQQLIADVLRIAHLTELPNKADKKNVWIEAVAKIKLGDGSCAYGIIKRNTDLSHRVCYINGNIAPISDVVEIYPYITLQKEYIKKFGKNEGEEARIKYLKSLHLPWAHTEGHFDNMTIDELNKEVVKAAIHNQMKDMDR